MGPHFGHVIGLLLAPALAATVLHATAQQPPRAPQPRPRASAPPAAQRQPARPAPRTEAAVPFRVGETLTYDVAWSGYLVAGSAVTRVVEKRATGNGPAYYIVAEGRPLPIIARIYALYYKMDSLLDSVTTLSQKTSLYTEEGTRKRTVSTTFSRGARRASFEMFTSPPVKHEFPIPPDAQDGLATLYALRAHAMKAGDRISVPVADEGMLYDVSFGVGGLESIKVPLGQVNAWKLGVTILDGDKKQVGSNIAAWISTDPRRLPLKIQADLPVGSFILALRTAQ